MLPQTWNGAEYVAIDLELTGVDERITGRPGICEIGGVRITGGAVDASNTFASLVNPMGYSSRQARKIHGIPHDMLLQAPRLPYLASSIRQFIGERILIAHGARAEVESLRRGVQNLRMPLVLDTVLLAKKLLDEKRGNSLENLLNSHSELRARVNRDFDPSVGRSRRLHTAYYDALAAAHLFVYLMERYLPDATVDHVARLCAYRNEMHLERAGP